MRSYKKGDLFRERYKRDKSKKNEILIILELGRTEYQKFTLGYYMLNLDKPGKNFNSYSEKIKEKIRRKKKLKLKKKHRFNTYYEPKNAINLSYDGYGDINPNFHSRSSKKKLDHKSFDDAFNSSYIQKNVYNPSISRQLRSKNSFDRIEENDSSNQNILTYTDSSKDKSIFRLTDENKPKGKFQQKYSISSTIDGSSRLTEVQKNRLDTRFGLTTTEIRVSGDSTGNNSLKKNMPTREKFELTPRDEMLVNRVKMRYLNKTDFDYDSQKSRDSSLRDGENLEGIDERSESKKNEKIIFF